MERRLPCLLHHQPGQQRPHRSAQRHHRTPPTPRPRIQKPRELPTTNAPGLRGPHPQQTPMSHIALLRNDDVSEADIPDTFDELIDLGKSLETKYPVMIQQDAAEGDPYTVYPVQTSFGAPVFTTDEDGNYTSELGMSGEAGETF